MKEYIEKSAVVAEIEKCHNECLKRAKIIDSDYWNAKADAYRNVLVILTDTLEVKEEHDIWHDVSEKPELEQPLLIIMKGTHKDFRRHYRIGCYGKRANDIPTWVIAGCYSDSFISKWCYISDILQYTTEVKKVDLDFQRFAKEMEFVFSLPSSKTKNTEEEPLNWEYAIAKHFYSLGLKTQKGE